MPGEGGNHVILGFTHWLFEFCPGLELGLLFLQILKRMEVDKKGDGYG